MISGKINLTALTHVLMEKQGKSGMVAGIFIPIEVNNLFKSDKGNVYLDLIAFDAPKPEYKQTHAIKQSLPKDVRDLMTEEQKKLTPFIGHLNTNIAKQEPSPQNPTPDATYTEDDDLPF